MYTIGIDEAGRGPVIGPLVMAGVLVHTEDEVRLKEIGVKDSKLIPEAKREELYDQITQIVKDYRIIAIYPEELDQLMKTTNLNMIEAIKSVEIIDNLEGQSVILDCPSVNVGAYADVIKAKISDQTKHIDAQHKADEKYLSVGAASILAKVTRDREIALLKKRYKIDFGSGYMSDEKTQYFIDEHFDTYPALFRKSWESWKKRKAAKCQTKLRAF